MKNVHDRRLQQLRDEMRKQDIDCVAICNSPNLFYMTGYAPKKDERFHTAFIPREGEPILAVPALYQMDSQVHCSIQTQRVWMDGINMVEYVRGIVSELGVVGGRIAIDDAFEFRSFDLIRQVAGNAAFTLGSALFTELRMRKSPEEIALMQLSGKLSDDAMQAMMERVTGGESEAQLKTWIEYDLSSKGMRDGFSNLIAFGRNTASVHHTSGDTVAKKGDALYFDLGGAYNKYWSDITRSFHIGPPSERYVTAYNRVREAQQLAFEAIKPGVRACDVHMVAYAYLEKHGLAEYFLHRLGHGMGLEGHELPNLSMDCEIELEPGMTFSCEPGVYFSGEFGIRIEDTVCVTETGAVSFNLFTKDLLVL
ncbi:MAG: putative peptidase [Desulfovibrio sp.]